MNPPIFIMDSWYVAATDAEIAADTIFARTICGEPVAFFRGSAGQVIALEDRCCHKSLPLHMGMIEGCSLRCGYHGMVFDETGRCTEIPGQEQIPPNAVVRAYPIRSRYGWIWIWMGDPALADDNEIPDYHWLDAPGWGARTHHVHVQANYRLIVENLLDLTHLTFVHGRTIGNAGIVKQAGVTFERGDREVKVTHIMRDVQPPPSYRASVAFDGPVDRWMIVHYAPPSFCRLYTGAVQRQGDQILRRLDWRNFNAITPETATTTHYFWGHAQAHDPDDDAVTDFVFSQIKVTFDEDIAIFEAQQAAISADPDRPASRFSTKADAGAQHAMRVLDRLLKEQASGQPVRIKFTELQLAPQLPASDVDIAIGILAAGHAECRGGRGNQPG